MIVDIVEFAKLTKSPRSYSLMKVLQLHAGWNPKGYTASVVSPTKDTYCDGFTFGASAGNACFILPVKKAKKIVLDTETKVLIFDDVVMMDVS